MRTLLRSVYPIGLLLSLASCDDSPGTTKADASGALDVPADSPSTPVPATWREALDALSSAPQLGAAFSFEFFGASPGNAGLQLRHLIGVTGDTCTNFEMFDAFGRNNPHDNWLLQAQTSFTSPGEYFVGTELDRSAPNTALTATASLTWMSGGRESERHIALSGKVTIHEGPTDETDWTTTKQVRATLELEFPDHFVESKGCMGSGSVSGGAPEIQCFCKDGTSEYTCRPDGGAESCCHDFASPRTKLSLTLTARPCAVMCRANSLLFVKRCTALQALKDPALNWTPDKARRSRW